MTNAICSDQKLEDERETFSQIVFNPDILDGKPTIRGTRLSVESVLEQLAASGTIADVVRNSPRLTEEDVRQAILFAAANLKNDIYLTADRS